jgi:hypothetical protein
MHVAEGVLEVGVLAVGLEAVVDRDAAEDREHAGVIEAVKAAFVVQRVERQPLGARGEQPAQLPLRTGAGLVEVRDRRGGDSGVHLVEKRLQILGRLGHERRQRAGRDALAEPVTQ